MVQAPVSFYDEYQRRLHGPWTDIQDYLEFLYDTAKELGGPVIELGTRSGESTSAFLAALETTEGELWSVDVNPAAVPAEWFQNPRWHFRRASDLDEITLGWLPQQAKILFIDTSHEYEHTLTELRTFVLRVSEGGIVLMHDTMWTGGAEGIKSYEIPFGPVTDALNDYCAETGLTWENRDGCFGMGTIRL